MEIWRVRNINQLQTVSIYFRLFNETERRANIQTDGQTDIAK